MDEKEMIRSLQKQVAELKAKLSEMNQGAPKREKVKSVGVLRGCLDDVCSD